MAPLLVCPSIEANKHFRGNQVLNLSLITKLSLRLRGIAQSMLKFRFLFSHVNCLPLISPGFMGLARLDLLVEMLNLSMASSGNCKNSCLFSHRTSLFLKSSASAGGGGGSVILVMR